MLQGLTLSVTHHSMYLSGIYYIASFITLAMIFFPKILYSLALMFSLAVCSYIIFHF